MTAINPQIISGKWKTGVALDVHTTNSVYTGDDQYGHPTFDTTYSDVGKLLNQLKYHGDQAAAPAIIAAAAKYLQHSFSTFDLIVPVHPSTLRRIQPVITLANGIGATLNKPVIDCIVTNRNPSEIKNITNPEKRIEMLKGLYSVNSAELVGKQVLLFDDLFRSGATMNEITDVLLQQGKAAIVYALTITRTRRIG